VDELALLGRAGVTAPGRGRTIERRWSHLPQGQWPELVTGGSPGEGLAGTGQQMERRAAGDQDAPARVGVDEALEEQSRLVEPLSLLEEHRPAVGQPLAQIGRKQAGRPAPVPNQGLLAVEEQ